MTCISIHSAMTCSISLLMLAPLENKTGTIVSNGITWARILIERHSEHYRIYRLTWFHANIMHTGNQQQKQMVWKESVMSGIIDWNTVHDASTKANRIMDCTRLTGLYICERWNHWTHGWWFRSGTAHWQGMGNRRIVHAFRERRLWHYPSPGSWGRQACNQNHWTKTTLMTLIPMHWRLPVQCTTDERLKTLESLLEHKRSHSSVIPIWFPISQESYEFYDNFKTWEPVKAKNRLRNSFKNKESSTIQKICPR